MPENERLETLHLLCRPWPTEVGAEIKMHLVMIAAVMIVAVGPHGGRANEHVTREGGH